MNHLLLAIGLSSLARVAAQTPSTYFVNPPAAGGGLFFAENKVYAVDSSINVQWVTDEDSYDIFLWQQSIGVESATEGSSPIYTKITGSEEDGGFSWTVALLQFSLNQSNVFFLALSPAGAVDLNSAVTSHYFNVTAASDTTSSVSSPASSTFTSFEPASTSIPTTTIATATFSPSSSSTLSPTADKSSSSSNTTIGVGVGVGLGLGIPLLLIIGFMLVPRRYRSKVFALKPPSYANSIDPDNAYLVGDQPAKAHIDELPTSELDHRSLTQSRQNVQGVAVELDAWQMRMSRAGHQPRNNS
ncbi:hypothetical protein H2202_001579 [Exophiala xenobiotica]|nr:hypothetical protein H2202_001579 [Exophiala xenobiotica]KAK5228217.1 hypothetical protein LTR72_002100 [Exophiala xenobiotica]KAK5302348.1 hypothetical protein LTR14_000597 [Exophiala xenobiotica]KAK5480484.1 hypothetical protein LTR55_006987 [Exophiala xenobiotica]